MTGACGGAIIGDIEAVPFCILGLLTAIRGAGLGDAYCVVVVVDFWEIGTGDVGGAGVVDGQTGTPYREGFRVMSAALGIRRLAREITGELDDCLFGLKGDPARFILAVAIGDTTCDAWQGGDAGVWEGTGLFWKLCC